MSIGTPVRTVPRPRPAPRGAQVWVGLVVFVVLVGLAATLGGLASADAGSTYRALELPPFAPPPSVFGPVWTVLYLLIAVAGWLVWKSQGGDRSIVAWVVQLVLNALWTPLFFGAGLYWVAFAELCLMWLAIVVTIALFWVRNRLAAALMVPYLVWVTFAGALNLAIALAN